ncbi:Putative NADP-dependent malic enzyme [Podospora comata]|uniref:NADP-dependent malic enzyme n=1 Tax=Podospora comata TaxID=48703 RepID=A0ABY6S3R2_PODCO|nr:Putative NADP-dependent malic enzyme [Podospora comata]
MASYAPSASSSDISTPRSTSPSSSSVASARSSHSSISTSKRMSISSSRRISAANPMSSVDIAAIEEAMRMANLDTLRGYQQKTYGEVKQFAETQYLSQNQALGYQVINEPMWNKGLSFTPEQRIAKNLTGLIPHVMEDSGKQCERALKMIRTRQTNIDRYLYLSSLKYQNADLFYRLLIDNAKELMPLVYTPTIGDVCLQYSTLYTRPEALYISIKQRKSIKTILKNWPYPNPEICVVTDGSRILGLGDLGVNGVGIPIGKLALYTAAAGIHPDKTLPIVLDCGTANEANLKDPLYLGLRSKRPSVAEQQEFMDEFMTAAAEVYPEMVVQFEDFESEKAFNYLDRYRNKYKCFNDDIQGTGAVVLGGYIGAVNLSGVPLEEQRLVFMGAGSAGVGVAKQLVEYYTKRGLSEQAAKDKFWLVDTKGLVTKDRGDKLAEHKKYFARGDNNGLQFKSLEEVIEYVKPTALVGLTATFGVFTESVVRALKASVDAGGLGRRPILFPLSNPLTKAECTFEQAVTWTDGTVIFASGSPFSQFTIKLGSDQAITYYPNQGNNVYVFPGIGLGAILAKATRVTDNMIYTSAAALAGSLNAEEVHKGLIYPRIERVRDASVIVAREVMKAARRDGVSALPEEQWLTWEEWGDPALDKYIKEHIYDPAL